MKQLTVEQIAENLRQKSLRFKSLFSTQVGQQVLKDLREEFDPRELKGEDTHSTYFNLGGRDVIMYIDQLLDFDKD